MMNVYWLILGVLAVWRISYLLASESGPWNAMELVRHQLGNGFLRELLSCLYCVSVWVALPFAFLLGESWKQRLMLWPALSAGAIIVERCIHREKAEAAAYIEDRDVQQALNERDQIDYRDTNHNNDEEKEHVLRPR